MKSIFTALFAGTFAFLFVLPLFLTTGCPEPGQCSDDFDCLDGEVCAANNQCLPDPNANNGTINGGGQDAGEAPDDAGPAADSGPAADAGPLADAGPAPDSGPAGTDGGGGGGTDGGGGGNNGGTNGSTNGGGNCATGGDVFDHTKVYLFGTLQQGACYLDAVAQVETPNTYTVGFGCYADDRKAAIRQADGKLVYIDSQDDKIYEFVADPHPWDSEQEVCEYPQDPQGNDGIVPTTACDTSNSGPTDFLLSPDDTTVWYWCDGTYYDENHAAVDWIPVGIPVRRGTSGLLLVDQGFDDFTLYDNTQTEVPITGLPDFSTIIAIRTISSGFRIAGINQATDAWELYSISNAGSAVLAGTYVAHPDDVTVRLSAWPRKLDADGNLYLLAYDNRNGTNDDAVVKLPLTGTASVAYTEDEMPTVRLHGDGVISGQ
jgi:hypothetical protein